MSSELLKQSTVDLATFPFARALSELWLGRRTGTIHLTLHNLDKKIILKDGSPVHASSNIAHEALGQVLVRRGEIDQSVMHRALSEAVATDRYLGEVLVEAKALTPYQLFTAMRRCIGAIVLDGFRWTEGDLLFDANEPDVDGKVLLKGSAADLVLRGVAAFSPSEQVAAGLGDRLEQPFQTRRRLGDRHRGLSFNAIESRVVRCLNEPLTIPELAASSKVDLDTAQRLVYALMLLDYVAHPAEVAREEPSQASTDGAPAVPAVETTPAEGKALSAEEEQEIDSLYLRAKSQDYFELLGVGRKAFYGEVKDAFLTLSQRCSPIALGDRDLGERGEQVEEVFLILARAFGILSDPHDRDRYAERLEKLEASRRTRAKSKVAEKFTIRTDLFEADQHIANGKKLLSIDKPNKALEHFRFAVNCESENATALACFGYAMFLVEPSKNHALALNHLQRAMAIEPANLDAHFFLGLIYERQGESESAYKAFSLCVRRNPRDDDARTALARVRQARMREG